MKVICINTEKFYNTDGTSVIKGSIYHVTNKFTQEEMTLKLNLPKDLLALGTWYVLLEIEGYHHESNFLELPEDLFNFNEEVKKSQLSDYSN